LGNEATAQCELVLTAPYRNIRTYFTYLLMLIDVTNVCVCSDASSNVRARAIKDYCNSLDPSHISFREGDLITVRHTSPVIAAVSA